MTKLRNYSEQKGNHQYQHSPTLSFSQQPADLSSEQTNWIIDKYDELLQELDCVLNICNHFDNIKRLTNGPI